MSACGIQGDQVEKYLADVDAISAISKVAFSFVPLAIRAQQVLLKAEEQCLGAGGTEIGKVARDYIEYVKWVHWLSYEIGMPLGDVYCALVPADDNMLVTLSGVKNEWEEKREKMSRSEWIKEITAFINSNRKNAESCQDSDKNAR